jgi:hypothetical protein
MAIHKNIEKHFRKHIPEDEAILATASNRSVMGDETDRYCLTERQIAVLHKPALIKWEYSTIQFDQISRIVLDPGVFKSTLFLVKLDKAEVPLMNIDNDDAEDFHDLLKKKLYNFEG